MLKAVQVTFPRQNVQVLANQQDLLQTLLGGRCLPYSDLLNRFSTTFFQLQCSPSKMQRQRPSTVALADFDSAVLSCLFPPKRVSYRTRATNVRSAQVIQALLTRPDGPLHAGGRTPVHHMPAMLTSMYESGSLFVS